MRAPYDLTPHYPVAGGIVDLGYGPLVAEVTATRPAVLAVDGPAALPWERLVGRLCHELVSVGVPMRKLDMRGFVLPWAEIQQRTDDRLRDDPEFASLCHLELRRFLGDLPEPSGTAEVSVVFGPGAAFVAHDRLWYADAPKRVAPAAISHGAGNLGQQPGKRGSERRLRFIDWPVQDAHKQAWLDKFDRYVDLTDVDEPRSLEGGVLRRSLEQLATRPFRTRPVFMPGAWGGQWMRQVLGVPTQGPNLAWSYELITPESGILLGDEALAEVGFELLMGAAGEQVVGADVAGRFGRSFPIRFDYLDTMDGGNLSLHCHPRPASMLEVFGWPYPQHESYYVMATRPGSVIFLGLRDDVDVDAFRAAAAKAEQSGKEFDVTAYVKTFPSREHQLHLIPAGTPHASGEGNVVLEISSTPYLYSLRFYDWLRRDLSGDLRRVHVDHAFANLDDRRSGDEVRRQLVPHRRTVRCGPDLVEYDLGRHPELFFAVHRLDFDDRANDDTAGRFHVLNLVAGEEIVLETAGGASHRLAYAETIVVPAAVGPYVLTRRGAGPCKVVKAFVLP